MILVMGTTLVDAKKFDKVKAAMKSMVIETLKEKGCVSYNLCEDLFDPGRIRISEEWETMKALEAHMETAHMKVWRAALADAGVLERKVKVYEGELLKTL